MKRSESRYVQDDLHHALRRPVFGLHPVLTGKAEEVLHFIRGKGNAVVEGRDYLIAPGMTVFPGPQKSHTVINDGTEDLHWAWFFLPSGLETFFKAIGRQRSPADGAPDAFARPENVRAIETSTGFSSVAANRLG
ncbi:cupin domain-containing protein [Paraburkholderia elongata]|uniref:Cupin type-2 domain-containing protein n=1 Tax=Paraburkholderia elongata TaxID=2675747 RepID=A0A972NWW1_9BURK|nr:cupin domain-containing protein [Paraburkholderia elongata]NPT61236.1 hypothetical protein [Paraburkholderia elongata]